MKRNRETLWYSAGGVIALVVLLVAANFIVSAFNARVDFTYRADFTGKLRVLVATKANLTVDFTLTVTEEGPGPRQVAFDFAGKYLRDDTLANTDPLNGNLTIPNSIALRKTRTASARSFGSPHTPFPVMRIAPNPRRWTGRSCPIRNSPAG